MTVTTELQRAKRGDIVVISRTVHDFIIGRPNLERAEHRIGIVTNVTRDGRVKAFRERNNDCAQSLDRVIGFVSAAIVPAARIDVAAAMKAAADHAWPSGHPWMPFDTLDEVRAVLKPCLLTSTDTGTEGVK